MGQYIVIPLITLKKNEITERYYCNYFVSLNTYINKSLE